MKKSIIIFIFCVFAMSTSVWAGAFKAGAALRVITPDPLLPVSGGVGTPNPVTEKKGDLFARALVLDDGTTRIAIVSIDNLGWPAKLGDKSRALIKDIAPENVIIGVTHTHSAPDAYGFPDQNGQHHADLEYLDWCVKQIADAVNEAVNNLEPASLKIAVDDAKGKIAFNAYAPRLYDPRMGVIQAIAKDGANAGKPIATLINYATHPEVLGSERGILSPDLCGPMYDRIEAEGGGIALFMNSAQGGMVTADVRRDDGKENNTWEECIRIGNLMADEALRIVENAPVQNDPGLYCTSKTIRFPIESKMMQMILQISPLGYALSEDKSISTTLNLVNIGTAQVLTIPGEALPNVGFYVKRHMNTKQPLLFGLTNDAFGYMIAKVDFNSFERYNYITRTSLGENTAEIYMNEAENLVSSSPVPDDDFVSLFNGKDLSGWYAKDGKIESWKYENGVLSCIAEKGGWLTTKKEYDNFVLHLEWRIPEGGNSGVGIRYPEKGDPAHVGMEIQVLDDNAEKYNDLKPAQYTGGIYYQVAAEKGHTNPPSEWNVYEITCNGPQVTIMLNGVQINSANMDEVTIANGDYLPLSERPRKGHIGMQSHGTGVDYRNVMIKELK